MVNNIASMGLLALLMLIAYIASPKEKGHSHLETKSATKATHQHSGTTSEKSKSAHVAGMLTLAAALPLFFVDLMTSAAYATEEASHILHPHGMVAEIGIPLVILVIVITLFIFLYNYMVGVIKDGGGTFIMSLLLLGGAAAIMAENALVLDYIMTIVVSTSSGIDQFLSIFGLMGVPWFIKVALIIAAAYVTLRITLRGREASSTIAGVIVNGVLILMVVMFIGALLGPARSGVHLEESPEVMNLFSRIMYLLFAAIRLFVALTGLEAVSNGIWTFEDQDSAPTRLLKRIPHPAAQAMGQYFSGRVGVARMIQAWMWVYAIVTSFLMGAAMLRHSIGLLENGRTLIANVAYIGFTNLFGEAGFVWFMVFQLLIFFALILASLTGYQDVPALFARRGVNGMGPESMAERDEHGTFSRSSWIAFWVAAVIIFATGGQVPVQINFYGFGVFLSVKFTAQAVRKHILLRTDWSEGLKSFFSKVAYVAEWVAILILIGSIWSKVPEGGWMVIVAYAGLVIYSYRNLLSNTGVRTVEQIRHITHEKANFTGEMFQVFVWQGLKLQEHRNEALTALEKLPAWVRALVGAGSFNPETTSVASMTEFARMFDAGATQTMTMPAVKARQTQTGRVSTNLASLAASHDEPETAPPSEEEKE